MMAASLFKRAAARAGNLYSLQSQLFDPRMMSKPCSKVENDPFKAFHGQQMKHSTRRITERIQADCTASVAFAAFVAMIPRELRGSFVLRGSFGATKHLIPKDLDMWFRGDMPSLLRFLSVCAPDASFTASNLVTVGFEAERVTVPIDILVLSDEAPDLAPMGEHDTSAYTRLARKYNDRLENMRTAGTDAPIPEPKEEIVALINHFYQTIYGDFNGEPNGKEGKAKLPCAPRAVAIFEFLKGMLSKYGIPSWLVAFIAFMGVSVFPRHVNEAVVITWARVGTILRAVFGDISVPDDVDPDMDFIIHEFRMKWVYIFHNILTKDRGYDKLVQNNVKSLLLLIASPKQLETIRKHSADIMREVDRLFAPVDIRRTDYSGTMWLPEIKPELRHAFFAMNFGAHVLSRVAWYFESSKVYWRNHPEEYCQFLSCVTKAIQFQPKFNGTDRFHNRIQYMLCEVAKFLVTGPDFEVTEAHVNAFNHALVDQGFHEMCELPPIINQCPWTVECTWCVVYDARIDSYAVAKMVVNPENAWIIENSRRLILNDTIVRQASKAEGKKLRRKAGQTPSSAEEDF